MACAHSCAASQVSHATSGRRFAEPAQTLIFCDFDDTLFPTAELFDRWGLPDDIESGHRDELTADNCFELELWENALCQFLTVATKWSARVAIVTNAKRPWVSDCLGRFAPKAKKVIEGSSVISVVYAREAYDKKKAKERRPGTMSPAILPSPQCAMTQEEWEEEKTAWKYAAMRKVATKFYRQYPGQTWKNVMSFGDMPYEHMALQDLALRRQGPDREQMRAKSFIFPRKMSLSYMTYCLRWYEVSLPLYVCFDGNFTIDVSDGTENRLDVHARSLNMPEFRNISLECDVNSESAQKRINLQNNDNSLVDLALVVQDAFED